LRDDKQGLTEADAEFRATQVQNVSYELAVTLDSSQSSFSGETKIRFDVSAVIANGESVDIRSSVRVQR
jgi:hypothetical protein